MEGYNDEWSPIGGDFQLCEPDVQKVLVSAYRSCQAGHRVVLDLETGSYMLHKKTKKFTPIYTSNGTFKFSMWLKKGKEKKSEEVSEDVWMGRSSSCSSRAKSEEDKRVAMEVDALKALDIDKFQDFRVRRAWWP